MAAPLPIPITTIQQPLKHPSTQITHHKAMAPLHLRGHFTITLCHPHLTTTNSTTSLPHQAKITHHLNSNYPNLHLCLSFSHYTITRPPEKKEKE
jgi:hypothetical protein